MAKWSKIWEEYKGFPAIREALLPEARFTKPAPAKSKSGGKFPHLQPFNRKSK